jgi:hypothetical protein
MSNLALLPSVSKECRTCKVYLPLSSYAVNNAAKDGLQWVCKVCDNKCPIFGFNLEWNGNGFRETSPSIDRIDSSRGYTKDNIQIISWKANRIKGYATVEDLEIVLAYLKQGE